MAKSIVKVEGEYVSETYPQTDYYEVDLTDEEIKIWKDFLNLDEYNRYGCTFDDSPEATKDYIDDISTGWLDINDVGRVTKESLKKDITSMITDTVVKLSKLGDLLNQLGD